MLLDPGTVTSRSTTFDNSANLPKSFLDEVTKRYGGSRLGRQELNGELIEDDPGAIFKRDFIEKGRVSVVPELQRIVVAVDPPAGFGPRAMPAALSVRGWALTAGVMCWMIIRHTD